MLEHHMGKLLIRIVKMLLELSRFAVVQWIVIT